MHALPRSFVALPLALALMLLFDGPAAAGGSKGRRVARQQAVKTWRLAIRKSRAFNNAKTTLHALIAKDPSLRRYLEAHRKALTLEGTSKDLQQRALADAVAFLKNAPAHERGTIVERAVLKSFGMTKAYAEQEGRRPNLPDRTGRIKGEPTLPRRVSAPARRALNSARSWLATVDLQRAATSQYPKPSPRGAREAWWAVLHANAALYDPMPKDAGLTQRDRQRVLFSELLSKR